MGAGVILGAAGLGVSVLGGISQSRAATAAGKQANKVAKFNAAVGEQEAIAAEDKAEIDEAIHRGRLKTAIGTLKSKIGKSGVTSPAQVKAIEASIEAGELDALAIRHGGKIEAARARSGAAITRAGGVSAERAGKASAKAGFLRTGGSLLSGGARLLSSRKDISNIPLKGN